MNGGSGNLFVLSSPSGGGKTTVLGAALKRDPDLRYSVSATTRPPRPGETDGVDYHFIILDFLISTDETNIKLSEEHTEYKWAGAKDISRLKMRAGHKESIRKFFRENNRTSDKSNEKIFNNY